MTEKLNFLTIRKIAKVIKICSTGGVLSEKDAPTHAQFVDEEIAAITTEAHRVGIKVMSHAQSPEGIKNAIRNGVDTIEHGIYLDEETIENTMAHHDEVQWLKIATTTRIKKFGEKLPTTIIDKAKQNRFLQYKGFTGDQIKYALKANKKVTIQPMEMRTNAAESWVYIVVTRTV